MHVCVIGLVIPVNVCHWRRALTKTVTTRINCCSEHIDAES